MNKGQVATKKNWTTPIVRKIELTDDLARHIAEQNLRFAPERRRRIAGTA